MKALLVVDVQESYFSKYDASILVKINKRIIEAQVQKVQLKKEDLWKTQGFIR